MSQYRRKDDGSVWIEVRRENRPKTSTPSLWFADGYVTLWHKQSGQHTSVHASDLSAIFDPITDEPEEVILPNLAMTFGAALQAVKDGRRIARAGWRGEWVCFMPPTTIPADLVNGRTLEFVTRDVLQGVGGLRVGGYMVLWTHEGFWQPGWLPSVQDIVANDWIVLQGKHGDEDESLPRYNRPPDHHTPL